MRFRRLNDWMRGAAKPAENAVVFFQKPVPAVVGFLGVLTLLVLTFRWSDRSFREARFLEDHNRYSAAIRQFERFAQKRPKDPRSPEALVRAARLYAKVFGRCAEAKPLYERAARYRGSGGASLSVVFPVGAAEPWASFARQGLLECPDYFPLRDGMKWTYVDSESGGKNMRLEFELRTGAPTGAASRGHDLSVIFPAGAASGEVDGAYYAGKRRFRSYNRRYAKEDWAIWEIEGPRRIPILKYPFEPGMRWSGRREGKRVEFQIESDREAVAVRAGKFSDCLKVRESEPGAQAWKFDYYAPGVGRVKTTIGGRGFERPNTELKKVVFPLPSDS